jgi:hypothetical protein
MEYECPQNGQQSILGALNPYYSEVGGKTDGGNDASVLVSEQQNPPSHDISHDQRMRKNTFPYAMEDEKSSDSATNQTSPHKYHNVHGLCAAMDKPGKGDNTTTTKIQNEYDVIERCNTTSSTIPAVVPKPNDGAVYSEPVEGEVYNVAYPVLTPTAESGVDNVDGYECLSKVH